MICREVTMCDAQIFELRRGRFQDLNIGGDISVAVPLAEIVKVFVRDLSLIELVIPRSKYIVLNFLCSMSIQPRMQSTERHDQIGMVRPNGYLLGLILKMPLTSNSLLLSKPLGSVASLRPAPS